jgi:hypothetical protein
MSQASPPNPVVVPTPQGPKIIGILSVVFGAILILQGAVQGLALLVSPMIERMAEAQTARQEASEADARRRAIEEIRVQERATEDGAEKARLAARRQAIESAPKPYRPSMTGAFAISRDPRLMPYQLVELSSGLILNALMVAAGVGLIRLRAWGRSLAMWVSGLKILWTAVMGVITVAIILPITVSASQDYLRKAMAEQAAAGIRPAPQMAQVGRYLGVFSTASAVGATLIALIFPAITLWVLTRPGARAACPAGGRKPGGGRADEAGASYSGREFAE